MRPCGVIHTHACVDEIRNGKREEAERRWTWMEALKEDEEQKRERERNTG